MAISENDIPCLQQIISVALCSGASVREVVNKLEDAIEGVYSPQGYGANDLDITTLVLRPGGRQLLFALNHKLGFPSLCTLHSKSIFTTIMPTIGTIHDEQFDENIWLVILASCTDTTTLCGVSIMLDEIALEEMAVHNHKYNKITGLCWKHSHLIDPVLCTYNSAVNVAQKIHNSEVHLGKELTVIGVTCFGEDKLYPILAALTCKTVNTDDMQGVLSHAIGCWKATGAAVQVGLIWLVATDGDATQRAAGHQLFVKNPLSPESSLYSILANMPGLNTLMGDNEITLDFNFKHIFKRFCTLLRNPTGIVLNNRRIINSMMLVHYLTWLPAYNEASIMKLLHPDDPQDVPQTIELMRAIIEFSNSQQSILQDSFLSQCTHRFNAHLPPQQYPGIPLMPFINTKLSLTEQVQHLSCLSHLSFTIFHVHC
ncbi:hypothetical protein BDR07DRAFT_1375049 [Suillus spraguei]|nr:hypothetical protein BDR07DRAFT_1375049 [Suillus spraguei]